MPVTKKKGAIFAIYTDSPAKSTRSHTHNPSPSTTSAFTHTSTVSPTKKSTSRKALATVQAKSVGFPSDPLSKADKGKGRADAPIPTLAENAIPSVNYKSLSRTTGPATTKRIPSTTSKRQFEIFRAQSPSAPPSPTAPIPSSRLAESPLKKTRATPRRSQLDDDDMDLENVAPVLDSPASRTRSRVRAASSAGLASPLAPLRLASRAAGEALLGDGRGTLTLKKGRAMAKLMKGAEVGVGDVLGDVSEAYGAEGSAPAGFTTQRR
ncbi:uncharacterized protein MKK02DRAFT_31994 [Dioszegia hungarica]|uniref:Uncharacterized protein n=1 Tax=Dioszegia hungarica TaxID=4972 RepID=A0AA38LWP1_9TREE|nr:uncharacterized protein MKK02DRAFT_31994 [Dioszegia hungarica]KAI9638580.1 hypothetical protein MKK02DRAFT_31994 [Dioszegia hungarica]